MVGGAKEEEAEEAEAAEAAAEAMPEEEGSIEEVEAETEAEEAAEPQPLMPMTQERATLQRIGGPRALKNKLCAGPPEQKQLWQAEQGPEQQEHWELHQWQQSQPLHPQEAQALEGTEAKMAEACAQCGPQQSLT